MQNQTNQLPWNVLLRKARAQRSWTQEEVAAKIAVDVKTVGRWESGKRFPIALHRRSLSAIYQKTLHELRLDEEPPGNKSIPSLNGVSKNMLVAAVPTAVMGDRQHWQLWRRPFVLVAGILLALVLLVVIVLALHILSFNPVPIPLLRNPQPFDHVISTIRFVGRHLMVLHQDESVASIAAMVAWMQCLEG